MKSIQMTSLRLRLLAAALAALTLLASANGFACPPGPRDLNGLTYPGLMMNFNRYMKNADGLINYPPEKWLENKDQILKAAQDMGLMAECAETALQQKETLLPSRVFDFPERAKTAFVTAHEKWMVRFKKAALAYQSELNRIYEAAIASNSSAESIRLESVRAASQELNDSVNGAHRALGDMGPDSEPDSCDSKL